MVNALPSALTDPEGWKNWFRQCAHEKMAAQLAAPTKQRRATTTAAIAPVKLVTSPATPIPVGIEDIAKKPTATLGHTDAMARLTETAMIPAITLLRPSVQVRDMRVLISEAVRRFVEQHGAIPQEAWIAPLRFLSLGCREYFALDEECAQIGVYSIVVRANEMAEDHPWASEHIWLWHDSLFGGVEIVEDYYL